MDKLDNANKRLKTAHDNLEREYAEEIKKLDEKEESLRRRQNELDKKKLETVSANGNEDAADGDLMEVNAGGKIIAAKRSTLTQLKGTRFEALFCGRWDKKLQRDEKGRIFLDVSPAGFRAIVDYLTELAISSEDSPPAPPSVELDQKFILRHQLNLFGLYNMVPVVPDSSIIKSGDHATLIHNWLEEDGSGGGLKLLYRASRDGFSGANFHSNCDNQGCTLTIIETTDGYVLGGYSNTPWASANTWRGANKAFLFVIAGSDMSSPCKMKLKNPNDRHAIYNHSSYGPTFGGGHNLHVTGSTISLNFGYKTYESSITGIRLVAANDGYTSFKIKEVEVFQVTGEPSLTPITPLRENRDQNTITQLTPVTRFTEDINKAIFERREALHEAELEFLHLESSFRDEQTFIDALASGEPKDLVTLNVSGVRMTTKRSTLQIIEDSVLAQQFDDTKWTEQGCNVSRAKEWSPEEVSAWVQNIKGIPEDVVGIFGENQITGRELLALNMEGLEKLGVERPGTLCLLLEEIKVLKESALDTVTFIEHSP